MINLSQAKYSNGQIEMELLLVKFSNKNIVQIKTVAEFQLITTNQDSFKCCNIRHWNGCGATVAIQVHIII